MRAFLEPEMAQERAKALLRNAEEKMVKSNSKIERAKQALSSTSQPSGGYAKVDPLATSTSCKGWSTETSPERANNELNVLEELTDEENAMMMEVVSHRMMVPVDDELEPAYPLPI